VSVRTAKGGAAIVVGGAPLAIVTGPEQLAVDANVVAGTVIDRHVLLVAL
jgi:hypothetical protein